MSALAPDLRGAWAVLVRDWQIVLSYRMRFITHLLSAFFSLTLFHFISRLVRISSFRTHDAYFAYAVIGLITLQVLNSTFHTAPSAVRQELVAGTFERYILSPFGALRGMLAMMVFPFVYALATALLMLVFAGVAFGIRLHWSTLPLMLPVGALGAISFASFGVLFLAIVLMAKQAITGATFVVAGISLISGLYFPISLLPAWMRWLADVQPFTPAADLLRHVMVDSPLHQSLAVELGKMVGFSFVLLPLSIWLLAIALRMSRRWGTILEY